MAAPEQGDVGPPTTELIAAEIESLMRILLRVDPEFYEKTVESLAWQLRKMRAVRAVIRYQERGDR
jgi:hypothetical protein